MDLHAPPKILVVEDEKYLRDLYVEILQSEGYKVDQAENGDQAYEMLHQGGYDLVVLDIMLPKIDGLQILEKLKVNPPTHPNKNVVILTNLDKEQIIAQGATLGIRGYMVKSDYTPEKLVKELKSYLEAN